MTQGIRHKIYKYRESVCAGLGESKRFRQVNARSRALMVALKNLYVTIENVFENAAGFHEPCSVKGFFKKITIKTKGSPRL